MHPTFIKAAVTLMELSCTAGTDYEPCKFAWLYSLSPRLVTAVINGKRRDAHVERQIAHFTELKLCELWPQHYVAPTTHRPSKALVALRAALG